MDILYRSNKLKKYCTDATAAERKYGIEMAQLIHQRIGEIEAADSVDTMVEFKIGRCHSLHHNREDQYAVDLVHPYRLVFVKQDNITKIVKIIEIVDYH